MAGQLLLVSELEVAVIRKPNSNTYEFREWPKARDLGWYRPREVESFERDGATFYRELHLGWWQKYRINSLFYALGGHLYDWHRLASQFVD